MKYLLILLVCAVKTVFAQDDVKFDSKLIAKARVKEVHEYILKIGGQAPDSTLFSKTSFDKKGRRIHYIKAEFTHDPKLSQWMVADSVVYNKKGQIIRTIQYTDHVVTSDAVNYYNNKGFIERTDNYYFKDSIKETTLYVHDSKGETIQCAVYQKKASSRFIGGLDKDSLGSLTQFTKYEFDNSGRLIKRVSGGVRDQPKETATYSYSKADTGSVKLISYYNEQDTLKGRSVLEYDKHGNFLRQRSPDDEQQFRSDKIYNAKGQVVEHTYQTSSTIYRQLPGQQVNYTANGATTIHHDRILYIYNAEGNPVEKQHYSDGKLILKLRWHYFKYDQ